jgi:cyclase
MLRKRLIFTLIYSDGFFMQSRNFRLQKVGDISWLEKNYKFQDISFSLDELIILNASRTSKDVKDFSSVVERLANNIFIPISAGGGINTLNDADILFKHGADKVVMNSSLLEGTECSTKIMNKYGNQSLVASIDYKYIDKELVLFSRNGLTKSELSINNYIDFLNKTNVGEVYFNSIDQDGTGFGFDIAAIKKYSALFEMPVIAAGGAGNEKHLHEAIKLDTVSAVSTANLFNFIGDALPIARNYMLYNNANLSKRTK